MPAARWSMPPNDKTFAAPRTAASACITPPQTPPLTHEGLETWDGCDGSVAGSGLLGCRLRLVGALGAPTGGGAFWALRTREPNARSSWGVRAARSTPALVAAFQA